MLALSRRIEHTKLYGPTVAILVAANLPGTFDFSSQRAGNAMLLMRFFAVNPAHLRQCTVVDSGYFVVGIAIERRGCNDRREGRALADFRGGSLRVAGGGEDAEDRPAAARHLRGARARIFK